eukprot:CAMPEP_0198516914 /NCGR_PEP_ID=MMETSP1462-20131121/18205_1 /TAXON_ID=1333877 /ORGANISM="Brandtodinium nutriculum, Strain RCC3387" /LENGTH=162 /DNA_ID=CAMNT_0044246457 /DNA_START=102 /DNA_END=587 /DNA_ORIENTATION=-
MPPIITKSLPDISAQAFANPVLLHTSSMTTAISLYSRVTSLHIWRTSASWDATRSRRRQILETLVFHSSSNTAIAKNFTIVNTTRNSGAADPSPSRKTRSPGNPTAKERAAHDAVKQMALTAKRRSPAPEDEASSSRTIRVMSSLALSLEMLMTKNMHPSNL